MPNKALQQNRDDVLRYGESVGCDLLKAAVRPHMAMVVVRYYCPCCGYPGLDGPAYRTLGAPPWRHPGPPPYERWYGFPSYAVCACCGFEFGNDDNPGTALPSTFEQYRREWVTEGCQWFDPTRQPAGWRVEEQFAAAGIAGPAEHLYGL